jgi:RimJ/RimL family protein N-acetyltransferase
MGEHVSFRWDAPVLDGPLVQLEPLGHRHAADLAEAAEEDRGSYEFTWVPRAAEVPGYIDAQLQRAEAGILAPYAQVLTASGRAVGATAYWDPRTWPGTDRLFAIEIGYTWLGASAQGTGVNAAAKFLLFRHAFENWGWTGSISRPTRATAGAAPRSPRSARTSRACCATGRARGRQARTASCATRRCSPSPPRNGRSAGRRWQDDWPRWPAEAQRPTIVRSCSMSANRVSGSRRSICPIWTRRRSR